MQAHRSESKFELRLKADNSRKKMHSIAEKLQSINYLTLQQWTKIKSFKKNFKLVSN